MKLSWSGYPGWDIVDPGGGNYPHPPTVVLRIRNKTDRSADDIGNELDGTIQNKFYWSEWLDEGGVFIREGDWYNARFSFQKKEDAYAVYTSLLDVLFSIFWI